MEIKKLFEQENVKTSSLSSKKISAYQGAQQAAENTVRPEQDQVSISPLYHQLNQIFKVVDEEQAQQDKRVADIKARVEAGTYSVDSRSVARSLVSFANDTKDLV